MKETKTLPRREFWKKTLGVGAAAAAYIVISRYAPPPEPFQEMNLRIKVTPKR